MANPIKIKATVDSIQKYGTDIYSVKFLPEGTVPRFKPGQFLHLTIDQYDPSDGFWPESRVFSIASPPGKPDIEIVYSVKGVYTKRMVEYLSPGKPVWLKFPYGNFIIDSFIGNDNDVVMIAGGTGISPFLSYFYTILDRQQKNRKFILYYGVRKNEMLLAPQLLNDCADNNLVDISVFVENEQPQLPLSPMVKQLFGKLDITSIYSQTKTYSNPVFFISGPPAMITSFKNGLTSFGVSLDKIIIDEWE